MPLSIWPYLSVIVCVYMPVTADHFVPIYVRANLSICTRIYLSIDTYPYLYPYLSIPLSICACMYLSKTSRIHLNIHLSKSANMYACVCSYRSESVQIQDSHPLPNKGWTPPSPIKDGLLKDLSSKEILIWINEAFSPVLQLLSIRSTFLMTPDYSYYHVNQN